MAVKPAVTPPDFLPTWATDGGAVNVDPGAGKRATGWLVGEAPAAGTMNNQLGAYGGWQEFMLASTKYMMAATNNDYTGTAAFENLATAPDNLGVYYRPEADRWYARTIQGGSEVYLQDSLDGETWSTPQVAGVGLVAVTNSAPPVTNGTRLAYAANEFFYLSTDLTVANLPAVLTPTSEINTTVGYVCKQLVWDATNALWIAAGQSAANNGFVDTSPDGITWTTRLNVADGFNAVATDGAGRSVISTNDTIFGNGRFYHSDNGTAWTLAADATTGDSAEALFFCPNVGTDGTFFCLDGTNLLYTSIDGGDRWQISGYQAKYVWLNEDFFMFTDEAPGNTMPVVAIIDVAGAPTQQSLQTATPGTRGNFGQTNANSRIPIRDATVVDVYVGSPNKFAWGYGPDHLLAVARFGPAA